MGPNSANAPRTLGGEGYEVWYVTFNDPDRRRGFWLRYTTIRPLARTGRPPRAELWAAGFHRDQPERNFAARAGFPLSDLTVHVQPFAVSIGDARLTADGCTGAFSCDLGAAEWDLAWTSSAAPFHFLPPRWEGFTSAANVAAQPDLRVSGRVKLGAETFEVDAAPGGQQHTWGRTHALAWNWGFASGFPGGGWIDGVTTRVRSRLGRVIRGTALGIAIDGKLHARNSLWQVLRGPGQVDSGRWVAELRRGRVRARVTISARPEDLVGVTYEDPAGGGRTCYHTEVADLELDLDQPGRPPVRHRREAGAAFEFASERPLPGVPPRF
jgi:hypothetical protein